MKRWFELVIAGLLSPLTAWAAPPGADLGVPEYKHTLSFGGGALGFAKEGPWTEPRAAAWTVTYSWSPATPVAWEVLATGAMDLSQPYTADDDQLLLGTIEGDMRVNIVPLTVVYPFLAAGVGYGAFERTRWGRTKVDTSTLTLPMSLGIQVIAHTVSFESRFTYRPTWFDDQVKFVNGGADTWQWTASLGARF